MTHPDVSGCHKGASGVDNQVERRMIRGVMNRVSYQTVSKCRWLWLLPIAAVSYCPIHTD